MAYKDKTKQKANWSRYYWRHTFLRLAKNVKRKDNKTQLTAFDIWKLAKRQKLICPLTGRRLTSDNISVDHIKHKKEGGKSIIENSRLVVKEANLARHIMSDADFLIMCQDVVNNLKNN